MLSTLQRIAHLLFPQDAQVANLESCSTEQLRSRCGSRPTAPTNTVCLFSYKQPYARTLIREIKYRANPFLVAATAELLAEEIMAELAEREPIEHLGTTVMITPVPMPKKRYHERGWNQSELLARTVANQLQHMEAQYAPALRRVGTQKPQTTLSRSARLKNMRGAFALKGSAEISGATVILIDDVTTTGTTLKEAKKVLKGAGAHEVMCCAVCH